MTSNKEDYLKAIYDAGGCDHYVSNKKLVERLGISPASVSEMLSKLHNDGLITYRAYHGSKLTEKGLTSCVDVVRNHELWEVFLIRHLGYSWWEAHEEAHHLEHVGSHMMIDRLDEFLGHPKTCPHGSPIPQKEQPVPRWNVPMAALSDLQLGEEAVIARISEREDLLNYLEPTGLRIGKVIRITAKDEYEGPVSFDQEGQIIQISYKAASQIYVNPVK